MMRQPFNANERTATLQSHGLAFSRHEDCLNASSAAPAWSEQERRWVRDGKAFRQELENVEAEYFSRLPRPTMSCCPFDGKPLVRSFDPFGLDGLWWRSDATPEEVPACPHFCVLLGAVNFAGHEPHAGDFDVHPGPQVPYVLPRLLEYPGMYAVISELRMDNGYIAYPVAYFAERRPPPQELTAGWARTNYAYTTHLGEDAWTIPNDVWDFDLRSWLEKGKIRWCPPGSDNSGLGTEAPWLCPYINLKGERQRMVVRGNRAWTRGLPNGERGWPAAGLIAI